MSGRKRNITIKKLVEPDVKPLEVLFDPTIETLKKYRHHYDLFIRSGEVVNFNHDIQAELLAIMRLKDPAYDYNRRCDACVCEFLVLVYRAYKAELGG